MGILDFLFNKRGNSISQASTEDKTVSYQTVSQESFKTKSLKEEITSNSNSTPTIEVSKPPQYTDIQISQIIDSLAKEAANYNFQSYEEKYRRY